MLVHQPYIEADGPNPKLFSSVGVLFVIRSCLSLVIDRAFEGEQLEEASVRLTRIKPYDAQSAVPAPGFDALDDLFLGTKTSLRCAPSTIGNLVNATEQHKRAPGKPSLTKFQYFTFTYLLSQEA